MVPVTGDDEPGAVWSAQGLGMPASAAIAPLSAIAPPPAAIAPPPVSIAPPPVSDSLLVAPPRVLEWVDRAPQALVKAATRDKALATRRLASPRTPKLRFALGLSFAPPTVMNGTYHAVLRGAAA
jgi:hypothetical protein